MTSAKKELFHALNRLAAAPIEQLAYLDSLGLRNDSVDELALEFDEAVSRAWQAEGAGEITEFDLLQLNAIRDRLTSIGGDKNAHLWTRAALTNATEWAVIRSLASDCVAGPSFNQLA
jgi:hypothetical protein